MPVKCKRCLSIRQGLIISLTFLAIALLLYFTAPDVFELLEIRLLNERLLLRGPTSPGDLVKIIFVDTSSMMKYGLKAEFREAMAKVLTDVCQDGARAVGMDLFFLAGRAEENNEARTKLAQAITDCGNVVEGFNWDFDVVDTRLADAEAIGRRRLFDATRDEEEPGFKPALAPKEAKIAEPLLFKHAAAVGYFTVITDTFKNVYKLPAALKYEDKLFFPFSLALVRTYLRQTTYGIKTDQEDQTLKGPQIGNVKLQTDPSGYLWFNHYGTRDAFESMRFDDVVTNGIPEGFAKGAIILIGVSYEKSEDLFKTPFDSSMPGVVLHATAVNNALSNGFLWRDLFVRAIEVVILVFCALILGLSVPKMPPSLAIFSGPILLTGLFAMSQKALSYSGMWIHLIIPFLLITLLHLVLLVARMRAAEKLAAQLDENS